MIWPFKKKVDPTDPFVEHIIQSLASDPESWTLEESKEKESWEVCASNHPEAQESANKHWNGSTYVKGYVRPVWRAVFYLKHAGGTISLYDRDAKNYDGWVIDVPRHAPISNADSVKLSKAVKQWREFMLAHDLSKNTPEQKLLSEAMKELDNHINKSS